VLNVDLPPEGGWGICSALKRHPLTRQIPLVIVSEKEMGNRRAKPARIKAEHMFSKSEQPRKILDAVEAAFGEPKGQQIMRIQRIAAIPGIDKARFIFIAILVLLVLLLTLYLRW
jgi:CheY-like chemotaxis protein